MTCSLCAGKGVIKIGYQDHPDGYRDYGICLCPAGLGYRTTNARRCLAAMFHVPADQVNDIENLLDPAEIPIELRPRTGSVSGDITDAGRTRKARL